jgi:hypothetical protein
MSEEVCVSHPLPELPSQSVQPEEHAVTTQVPLVQLPVPFAGLQAIPQPPQFAGVLVGVSQPSARSPLQFAKPGLHVTSSQVPLSQLAVPFGKLHLLPQAPQLFRLVEVSISQPSNEEPLQSFQLPLQAPTWQLPPLQFGTPFVIEQPLPQPPQFCRSVCVFTSQPFDAALSQSAKPLLQDATAQLPVVHAAVEFGRKHRVPQPPQLSLSFWRLTSQPSNATPLQSSQGELHAAIWQAPFVHVGLECARLHETPQPLQLLTSLRVFVSQPVLESPSQSPHPGVHAASAQVPPVHAAPPFVNWQAVAQEPQ